MTESEARILAARVQKLEERRDRDTVRLGIIEKKLDVLSRQIDALERAVKTEAR